MENSHLLNQLNDPQREAVCAPESHYLILAGAGTGKTTVLVHRMAWLVQMENVSPFGIMAVTFTNKAANEMRSRLGSLLTLSLNSLWVGTFHNIAHRLLRLHWQEANLPQSFQILDSDDQYRFIRRILISLDLDETYFPPKKIQWFINAQKDEGLRADQIRDNNDLETKNLKRIYLAYENACQRAGLVDFAEILLRSYELLQKNPALLAHYQQRFRHVLVDEFQDTNTIQYAWLKLWIGENNYLMTVGDDDQSIYGWRGAKIENIQRFHKDFPDAKIIRLEQNYRSTATILSAANALIDKNQGRLGKNLWTPGEKGEPISVYAGFNDLDEAQFIVEKIQQAVDNGLRCREIALLYRSNAQSRVLEEALINKRISYRIYGGLRFYERAEIKDTLAYLRLIANHNDDTAFERVVNTPTRGIGEQTVSRLRDEARAKNISLWQASSELLTQKTFASRAANALRNFISLIDKISDDTADLELSKKTEHTIHASGLYEHFQKEKGEKGEARLENLGELITASKQFNPDNENNLSPLDSFLAHIALETGEYQSEHSQDCVQLMTLHSAKGLEFPLVFLCGMEEGLFPHHMSSEDPKRLEEERRLCYVGMTRAMKKLFITYAEIRRLHGSENYHRPSRFISEIPTELMQAVRLKTQIIRRANTTFSENNFTPIHTEIADMGLRLGQRVKHPTYGEGVIVKFEGENPHMRVWVNFAAHGSKLLIAKYAKLEIINEICT